MVRIFMPRNSLNLLASPALAFSRRSIVTGLLGLAANAALGAPAWAAPPPGFSNWVAALRPRALKRGVSPATYDRTMGSVSPDMSVFEPLNAQPEFKQDLWQYINRRCSEWRVMTGRERLKEHADLLARIEKDYGVDRHLMVALWGMESSFGSVIDNTKYMRPVIPALAALAWREPRRRRYWEAELINALVIVERGWATPSQMIGSWAGAMGHTQWMPEVWLRVGVDYDRDGRVMPFGNPADAFAGSARYLVERGRYRRGEAWGYEVKLPDRRARYADNRTMRSYATWAKHGIARADGKDFTRTGDRAKLWLPERGGPAFLVGQNFLAVRTYNPSNSYALTTCLLGDLIREGRPTLHRQFPGGERTPTTEEIKEIQRRLTEQGFATDGVDGRTGSDTVKAILAYQKKVGMKPDGYAGLRLLTRLRQGS
jgi:lytic murein transglycosylase